MGRIDDALRRTNRDVARDAGAAVSAPAASPWRFGHEARLHEAKHENAPANEILDVARTEQPVAVAEKASRFHGFDPAALKRLVVAENAAPLLVEQFRSLAATLNEAQNDQKIKSLVVTSASPNDGKSFVSMNLALTLSDSYKRRVLLVDADLRRPTMHRVFRISNQGGLSEGLQADQDDKIQVVQVSDTLTLLPAGRPDSNPLGNLSSERMKRIVEEASARFDWVIVDTPPVGVLADGRVVSEMVDGVLIVVRAGATRFEELEAAVETMGRERILGVVLNGVEVGEIHSKDYYYRHYYYGHDAHAHHDDAISPASSREASNRRSRS